MNLSLVCQDLNYSLSGSIVTLSVTFNLVDLDTTDANGNPKVLDTKTISVRQNILDTDPLLKLKQKIITEVQDYLVKAKNNVTQLYNMFGTLDPETILTNLKNDLEQEIQNLVSSTFGGN